MQLDNLELIHKSIQDFQSILIPIPEVDGEKVLGTAIALASLLKSEGKNVTILSSYVYLQEVLKFLDLSNITSLLQGSVESVISVDITQYPVSSLKYDKTDTELRIYLNSPSDKFRPELISVYPGQKPYDLIITLDTKNWTQLGSHFLDCPHIFLGTPSLAISAMDIPHPYSERMVVENKYVCSAEMVFEYIKAHSRHSLNDKNIVNGLLLSMILAKNHSLALEKTMIQLRELPNDYDLIVKALESIISDNHRLLIGRILAHLEFIEFEKDGQSHRYAYSKLFPHDFTKTNTTEQDIIIIYRELFKYLPNNIIGLHILVDKSNNSKQGYLSVPDSDMSTLQSVLEGEYREGVLVYNYVSNKDIHETGRELNQKIKESL